jgi:trehalose 6-phosphate phosphatase
LPHPSTAAGRGGLAALRTGPAGGLIGLDYDGTLAPIVTDPGKAQPGDGAREALRSAAGTFGTVAIVTGRPATDAARLGDATGVPGLLVLGHYGLQRWSGGRLETPEPVPGVAAARHRLPGLLAGAPSGVTVEDKKHSLAVHTRQAADPTRALDALREPLGALAGEAGLELAPGRFVLELRPPGTDKGGALRSLVAERGARAVLYAGDDLGDLPAYAAVEDLRRTGIPGVTVCAASAEVDELARRADLVVDGPAGVVALLLALCEAARDRES